MNQLASSPDSSQEEIYRLANSALCGDISAAEWQRLEQLVAGDPTARRWYVEFICDACNIRARASSPACRTDFPVPPVSQPDPRTASPQTVLPFGFLGNAFHGTVGYFSSGWPLAYLIATMIFGVGLLIGSLVPVSQPEQIARQSSVPSRMDSEAKIEPVGRITGTVDCRWMENPKSEIRNPKEIGNHQSEIRNQKSIVALGDRFALSSGLMEITYDSGARVILQGPVTYEVESAAGGYLSVGKLTARVDKGSEISDKRSDIPHPSSLIPHPLFSVRTPTATVTDLGTEFGVTVSTEGLTQIHVLQGTVDTRSVAPFGDAQYHKQLTEGSAVEIGRKGNRFETVAFAPQSFVRKFAAAADAPAEAAYIKAVLADKPLGYWPLNEPAGARKFLDRSGNGFHGYAMNKVTAGQAGPLSGNSRAVAIDGDGYIDVGRHDEFAMVNDFTLEAWVCIGQIESQYGVRVIGASPGNIGSPRMIGWVLEASTLSPQHGVLSPPVLRFATYGVWDHDMPVPSEAASGNRWLHVAAVSDRDNTARFYLNGKVQKSFPADKPGNRGPVWVEIGGGLAPGECWRGRLAHVAVYPRALSGQQIQNHYNQNTENGNVVGNR